MMKISLHNSIACILMYEITGLRNYFIIGRNLYCIDKNYGGILIIWYRIFGK